MSDEARRLFELLNDGKTRWCAGCKERQDEIDRLREIIRRMDGLVDSGEAALAVARHAAEEALDETDL